MSHSTREKSREEEVKKRRGAKERARRWLHTSRYTCVWGGGVIGSSPRSIKRFFSEYSRAAIVFHFTHMRHRLFLTFQSCSFLTYDFWNIARFLTYTYRWFWTWWTNFISLIYHYFEKNLTNEYVNNFIETRDNYENKKLWRTRYTR